MIFLFKIALCDDEQVTLLDLKERITKYIEQEKKCCQIFCFSEGKKLIESNEEFDIIFLDIQMDGLNGLETAKKLRILQKANYLVFVTVSKDYILDAFEVEASDYILKPIDNQRFFRAMKRIFRHLEKREPSFLMVQKGSVCKNIKLENIIYCEAINRKIYIHTKKEVTDYYFKLEELEKLLNNHFFRCHRSYIINLDYVYSYEKGVAWLENGEKIPVSRLRGQDFAQAILHFLKERRG